MNIMSTLRSVRGPTPVQVRVSRHQNYLIFTGIGEIITFEWNWEACSLETIKNNNLLIIPFIYIYNFGFQK